MANPKAATSSQALVLLGVGEAAKLWSVKNLHHSGRFRPKMATDMQVLLMKSNAFS